MWIIVPYKGSYNTDHMRRIYEDKTGTYADIDGQQVQLSDKAVMCDILNALEVCAITVDVDASWIG